MPVQIRPNQVLNGVSGNPGVRYSCVEHFFNGSSGTVLGLAAVVTGGAVSNINVDDALGVALIATGTTASANQRAAMAATNVLTFGYGRARTASRVALAGAVFSGALSGVYRVGFIDNAAGESTDGCFFRSTDGAAWQAVCRSNNTETAVNTGVALPALNTWTMLDVQVEENGQQCAFFIDGVRVAEILSNIPVATGRATGVGIYVHRNSSTGTNVQMRADFLYFDHWPNPPIPLQVW